MSKNNPGVIFDASNSWNGFNHQGKLAILFSIKQILDIYESPISEDEKKTMLCDYFIEIEHLEDFSLGKVDGGKEVYYYVHQVKNHATDSASNYDSALLCLAYHLNNIPTLQKAYLHTTTNIDFKGDNLTEYVKKLISSPTELQNILKTISESRNDKDKKKVLYTPKRGRPKDIVVQLKQALLEIDPTQNKLNAHNIDKALDALEKKTRERIHDISSLNDDQIKKIELYLYDIEGKLQNYCEVNQIESLIKKEIERSISVLNLSSLWLNQKYIKNRYLYLLGKLDEHIIDRNLNYPLYSNNELDRKIRLFSIFEWLISDEIDTADEEFYQYEFKNIIFKYTDEFCENCKERKCDICSLIPAINKIGQLSNPEMREFLTLTCPNNNDKLSTETFSRYLTYDNIQDQFLKGISEIRIPFEEDKKAITYIGKETLQYILTTLYINNNRQDIEKICTDIVKNKELYELLMDYDCFISKNISCSSIQDEALKLGKIPSDNTELEERRKEHIAHLKDVKIVTLEDFENSIG